MSVKRKRDAAKENWGAIERHKAAAIKRRALPKWETQLLRGKVDPGPLGYDVSPMSTDPSSDEAPPAKRPALTTRDGGVTGDFLGNRNKNPRVRKDRKRANRNARRALGEKKAGKRPRFAKQGAAAAAF